MPRIARVVLPGLPHHVTQRGNYRQKVFRNRTDRRRYLLWVKEYSQRYGLEIWAYCLMDNHVHFIVVPQAKDSLAMTLNQAHMCYAQYFNRAQGKRGHLWQGRFYSCPLDDPHLYAAVRYVEQNPVRSGLVKRAEDYPWSSAPHRVKGVSDLIISDGLPLRREIADWQQYLAQPEEMMFLRVIRGCTASGRPAGGRSFVRKLEQRLGRALQARPRGRPRRRK